MRAGFVVVDRLHEKPKFVDDDPHPFHVEFTRLFRRLVWIVTATTEKKKEKKLRREKNKIEGK